ncbi:MAG: CYCXC family (seleno)protein [Terriglobia bacterium]|jgi:hypothetical protein|nr:CYCXC family (seleno)protein [Terriglobia bacterium]
MRKHAFGSVLVVLSLAIVALAQSEIPAYHIGAPPKGAHLAPIVPRSQRTGEAYSEKYQQVAYDIAQKIPGVLYQLPCYCYCDRIGHKSLRTCYESDHAAHCATCLKEAYYAYFETKKGKTAKEIRAGIIKGEFQSIDLIQAAERVGKM